MKTFLDFFSPPVFRDDEDKTRSAYYLNAVVLTSLPVISIFLIFRLFIGTSLLSPSNLILAGIIIVLIIVFLLEKSGYIKAAGYLHISTIWIASTLLAISANGTRGTGVASYFVVIALAGLLLGYKPALRIAALSILSMFGLAFGEFTGNITPEYESPLSLAVQNTVLLIFISLFMYLSIASLQQAIKQAREKSEELEKNNKKLKDLHETLENRVKERTDNLLKANIENKRRATQFQTVSQITQKIASERDLDTLLTVIAEVIATQFDYYHVGIYLNDDTQEYAILSAASSETGKNLLEHGYKLPLEQTSLIGYVGKTGTSRTNTGLPEETHFDNPNFPETNSEFGIPLKAGTQVIGVLDVQSKQISAFDSIDIEALTALANQITIAIQNTRLFTETQTALAESQLLYGTVVKQTWKANIQNNSQIGYRYTGARPVPLTKEVSTPEIRDALENGDIAVTHPSRRKDENALAVPLKLRETTIGVINITLPTDADLGEDEIDIVLAASQRIAIALENASLLEESQRRAKREQTISEMSAKISAGTEIETILKTALSELGNHISGAQITVELGNEDE